MIEDDAARERIRTALCETLFVEAGAGTGKTASLVGRIVELVATGRASMSEIAAITFTDAAAAELRDRVRRALEERAATDPRCGAAVEEVDQAAILTLHAFARRLLAAYPLEAGVPPDFEVADEVTSQLVFSERWNGIQARVDALLADPALAGPLRDGFALGLRLDHIRDLARALDRHYDRLEDDAVLPATGPAPEPIGGLVDAIANVCRWRDRCADPADRLAAHLVELEAFANRLRRARDDRERLRLLRDRKLRHSYGRQSNWNGCIVAVRAELSALEERRVGLLRATHASVLVPLLERLRRETLGAAARRAADGRLEFHDLLVLARRLLRDHPSVRNRLAARYRYLLIDEFQDTDPLQAEIATRLAGDVPGGLFFVGDAQQSIYRFRRADIATYQEIRDRHAGGVVALTRNHRSVPSVIAWANATFASLLDGAEGQARHQPLVPHRPAAGPGSAVRLLGREVDGRAADIRDRESAAVAAAIAEIAGRWAVDDEPRPARYADIAILLPTRTALPQLEQALQAAEIPYRVEAQSLLYATQEVRDLLAILRAIDDPADEVAIVATLRSPAFACTDRDLVTWRAAGGRWDYLAPAPVEEHPVAVGLAALAGLHERRSSSTPSGIVAAAIRELRLFELACAHRRTREAWQRLRVVQDQARAFTERGASLRDLCAWMRHLADENTRVTEQVLPDDDDDAVRVLTVHGAKGLEFPVVVLAGLASQRRPPPGPVVVFDAEGVLQVRIMAGFSTPGFAAPHDLERRLDALEELRLLYVAATRARDHLVVGVHHTPTRRSAARTLWEQARQHPELWQAFDPAPPVTPAPATTVPAASPGAPGVSPGVTGWLAERERWIAERDALLAAAAEEALVVPRSAPTTRNGTVPLEAEKAGRWWRDVPVVAEVDGVLVEAVADLLYPSPDGLVLLQYGGDPASAAVIARALEAALGQPLAACRLLEP